MEERLVGDQEVRERLGVGRDVYSMFQAHAAFPPAIRIHDRALPRYRSADVDEFIIHLSREARLR